MKILFTILFAMTTTILSAQEEKLPYYEIPAPAEDYTAGAVASRMIDGLGFRFYWATEGLRKEDLAYKPGDDARTSLETIEHIYSMSFVILNASKGTPNVQGQNKTASYAEMRKTALLNFKTASDALRTSTDEQLKEYDAVFQKGDEVVKRPFWMVINGPIADCIWHCGQIVSFRRQSGNPFSGKVSLFTGTVSE